MKKPEHYTHDHPGISYYDARIEVVSQSFFTIVFGGALTVFGAAAAYQDQRPNFWSVGFLSMFTGILMMLIGFKPELYSDITQRIQE